MNNAQRHIKAGEKIAEALKALKAAADLIAGTQEYNEPRDPFYSSAIRAYNRITTASQLLNSDYLFTEE